MIQIDHIIKSILKTFVNKKSNLMLSLSQFNVIQSSEPQKFILSQASCNPCNLLDHTGAVLQEAYVLCIAQWECSVLQNNSPLGVTRTPFAPAVYPSHMSIAGSTETTATPYLVFNINVFKP